MKDLAAEQQRIKAVCDHVMAAAKPEALAALDRECVGVDYAKLEPAARERCAYLYRSRCDGAERDDQRRINCSASQLFHQNAYRPAEQFAKAPPPAVAAAAAAALWPGQKEKLDKALKGMKSAPARTLTEKYLAANPAAAKGYVKALEASCGSPKCESAVMASQLKSVRKALCSTASADAEVKKACGDLVAQDAAAKAQREKKRQEALEAKRKAAAPKEPPREGILGFFDWLNRKIDWIFGRRDRDG
jgi:hypothetical protein